MIKIFSDCLSLLVTWFTQVVLASMGNHLCSRGCRRGCKQPRETFALNRIGKSSAFTLIEVLLAMSVLSTSLFLLMNAWSGSFARLKKSQDSFLVASLLERKMGEIERKYRGRPLQEIPEDPEEGDFGSDFPKFKWTLKSRFLTLPDLVDLMNRNSEDPMPGETQSALRSFTETLSKSVKEVTLTVYFETNKKTFEYPVTTYFVDYDAEISLVQ